MDRIGHNTKRTMSAAEFQRAAAEFEDRVRSLIRNPGDLHNLHKARSFADRISPYKYVDKVPLSDRYAQEENLAEAAQNTEGKVVKKLANWAKSIFSRINFRKMVK